MSVNLQTTPAKDVDGTVLISMKDGEIKEVISDLQLNVQVFDVDHYGYRGFPSRPLWEYVRKATNALLSSKPAAPKE